MIQWTTSDKIIHVSALCIALFSKKMNDADSHLEDAIKI